MKPFRFGVSVRSLSSRTDWREGARSLEALGYDTFLLPDHLAEMPPPLLPLLAAADATTNLRIGTFVLNNDFRHPALVARDAAAIDLLSDGRLELGIGGGHMQSEYEEVGLAYEPAATRLARLAEAVAVIKRLLAGEEVSFAGRFYHLERHRIHPRPLQAPHPPLLVGGNSREVLSLAAREADIVSLVGFGHRQGGRQINPSGFSVEATAERVGWIRDAAGDRFSRLELNALVQRVVITADREAAAANLARELPVVTQAEILSSPFLLIGSVEEVVDQLWSQRETFGLSYYVVFEGAARTLAPVIAEIRKR